MASTISCPLLPTPLIPPISTLPRPHLLHLRSPRAPKLKSVAVAAGSNLTGRKILPTSAATENAVDVQRVTGPLEITTRWTMKMHFALLPWKLMLVFTGVSIMGINPQTGKFSSHLDIWDSTKNNDYFSVEGLLNVIKQCCYYKTRDLDTPKYKILKKTEKYEVTQSAHRSSQPEEGRRWLRSSIVIQRVSDRRGCAGERKRIEVCTSWGRPRTARGLLACSVQRFRLDVELCDEE